MSQKQQQAALDTLQRDSLDILSDQWIRETEAAIQASEQDETGDGWDRFLGKVAA